MRKDGSAYVHMRMPLPSIDKEPKSLSLLLVPWPYKISPRKFKKISGPDI
jgi:hypothetical protein